MRRYHTFSILVGLVLASAVRAEVPVSFNDANLKAAVEHELNKTNPTPTDMLGLYALCTDRTDIQDLTGLEHAVNLGWLCLPQCSQITDVSPLAGLANLQALYLHGEAIDDLSPLATLTSLKILHILWKHPNSLSLLVGLTSLTQLNLGMSGVVSDVSPLAALTKLTFLNLTNNEIIDVSPLAGLAELTELYLHWNQISDVDPLASLTNLSQLQLDGNMISDVTPLAALTNLTNLYLSWNFLSDVSGLAVLTKLTELTLHWNQIGNIGPLAVLTDLTKLDLSDNQISDISAMADFHKLRQLNLKGNRLNSAAYTTYIPQIRANNPGIELLYDPPVLRTLTVSCTEGGSVLMPGEGQYQFVDGQTVSIEAVIANGSYRFLQWTGSAVTVNRWGKVANSHAMKTTVLVDGNYTLRAVFTQQSPPAFGFSLGDLGMDDPQQFESRVFTNNTPVITSVERITGEMPDPNNGMMQMHVVNGKSAQAKGRFGRTVENRIWIEFKYLFESPDVELVVYLSDSPQVGSRDPNHVHEVARLVPPAPGRPGAVGSGRYGQFEQWVDTTGLDLTQGTWVELELVQQAQAKTLQFYGLGPARWIMTSSAGSGGSAYVDDWSVNVHCSGICMDLNWSTTTNEEDFLLVMAAAGHAVGAGSAMLYCCEGLFSEDAYIDGYELPSWDWLVKNQSCLLNLCSGVPLAPCTTCGGTAALARSVRVNSTVFYTGLPEGYTGWVILGKRTGTGSDLGERMIDGLYLLDGSGRYDKDLSLRADRCNVRVLQGRDSRLYLIHSEAGIVRLEADGTTVPVVPVGTCSWSSDPRYNRAATISMGIQNPGTGVSGRPILDAVISNGSVYVVPVVVSPTGAESYVAAARLDLRPGQDPLYEVNRIYDDPNLANKDLPDNPNLSGLREIEVDEANNVYVLNAHGHNESDVLWKYGVDGKVIHSRFLVKKGDLSREPDPNVPDPIGLCVDNSQKRLYMASGQADPHDPNSAWIKGFSTEDLGLERTVRIRGMQHVTAMGLKGQTGVLWVVGYRVKGTPNPDDPSILPEFEPCLAEVSVDATEVDAVSLAGAGSDLALPMSIVWMGQ